MAGGAASFQKALRVCHCVAFLHPREGRALSRGSREGSLFPAGPRGGGGAGLPAGGSLRRGFEQRMWDAAVSKPVSKPERTSAGVSGASRDFLLPGQEFIIHSPDFEAAKFWVGNLGKTATHAVVFAQLHVPGGQCHGLHIFIVQVGAVAGRAQASRGGRPAASRRRHYSQGRGGARGIW